MTRDVIATYVGERLQQKRVAAQLSLRDVSKLAGISAAGISLIEVGTVLVPLDTLFRLSAVYGCDPRELLPTRSQVVKG